MEEDIIQEISRQSLQISFLAHPEFEISKVQPKIAKVVSDTDPQNQGRIQVQFDWQMRADKSEFIRMMIPDAENSDKVNKNRGLCQSTKFEIK